MGGTGYQGQPTHFSPGRQWGVFSIKLPKDFGTKKLTWTIVANGLTNAITLHTQPDYVVEPFEDAANKNTPPKLKFRAGGPLSTGAPVGIAEKYTATVGDAAHADGVGDRRGREDQRAGRPRPRPRRGPRGRHRSGRAAGAARVRRRSGSRRRGPRRSRIASRLRRQSPSPGRCSAVRAR